MSIFNRKTASASNETLQDIQNQFNQLIFRIGDLHYRKTLINTELGKVSNELTDLVNKANELGVKASKVKARIQEEMTNTVAKAKKESNEESTKNS